MSKSARLSEAEECVRKAEECMKVSMIKLKFKPDYDGAASALERASVCYRNAGEHGKAAAILQQAADHYENNRNFFHAAKAREGSAMLLREAGKTDEAFPLFDRAIDGYAEAGSLDTAAMTVEKAADIIKQQNPEKAIQIYTKGLALVQQSDRSKMAGEFLKQLTRLHLRLNNYAAARASIRDEIEKYIEVRETPRIGQLAIALVLVNLAQEDVVSATKEYGWVVNGCPSFRDTDDARVCESLIGYYESGDDQQFQNVLKCGALRSMDNEYLRLMKDLHTSASAAGEEEEEDLR
ncbi:unnamed protein product [Caenorhabditis auriculariae]|uniref:Gamma-soluble NSF attachment protein n=1 Tax=Caenorhabditis auriculariae TaxID=2777116 RepID=A0A8S1GT44_9PELO|nr:unnamed protein product [Caenorhabditis auriculariae]